MKLTPVIGLETHVQLKTKSKMFCSCDNAGENKPANTTVCPVCMGHPGVLPVANRTAIEWSVKSALAINCNIPKISKFDRKSYFYPDLPKAYQISQYDQPIGSNGFLEVKTKEGTHKIRINRLHLEEDAAKNFHAADGKHTLIDYNRSSTPLMEIVSEPDIRSAAEAKAYLQELRLIMRYLGVSDADMEKGHLRCDANISLTDQQGEIDIKKLKPKTEIKNLNSFKAVERALEYEIKRQTKLWEEGKIPDTETTRGWDENKGITEEQRGKEGAADYRYFPDPDLPPINFNPNSPGAIDVEKIKNALPELPAAKRQRFIDEYGMSPENIQTLTSDLTLANFFENSISELRSWLLAHGDTHGTEDEVWDQGKTKLAKLTANWLTNKLLGVLVKEKKELKSVTPENFAEFITMLFQNKINSTVGLTLLEKMVTTGGDPSSIIEEQGLQGSQDSGEIAKIVDQIITANPDQVQQYKAGKTTVIQYFIGQLMKQTKGQANPEQAKELFEEKLK